MNNHHTHQSSRRSLSTFAQVNTVRPTFCDSIQGDAGTRSAENRSTLLIRFHYGSIAKVHKRSSRPNLLFTIQGGSLCIKDEEFHHP